MNYYVLDTYAWIEYFEGTSQGHFVKELVESKRDQYLFTPAIVLAELADALVKGKLSLPGEDLLYFVKQTTTLIPLSEDIAYLAGTLKRQIRKKHSDFGLIDALVLATAHVGRAQLVTGDPHLVGERGVVDLRSR